MTAAVAESLCCYCYCDLYCTPQVGLLRVILSLEDKGAAAAAAAASPAGVRQYQRSSSSGPLTPLRSPGNRTPPKQQLHAPAGTAAAGNAAAAGATPAAVRPYALRQQQLQQGMAAAAGAGGRPAPLEQDTAAAEVPGVNSAASGELPGAAPGGFRQMPEYLVAWELEVWKKVRLPHHHADLRSYLI
jgi:hypothetical protein